MKNSTLTRIIKEEIQNVINENNTVVEEIENFIMDKIETTIDPYEIEEISELLLSLHNLINREYIDKEIDETSYFGKSSKDDVKLDPNYGALSLDSKAKINTDLEKGKGVNLGENDNDFEQESPSEKDIKAGEKEFGDVGIENVKSEDKERFEKLNRAIKNKVAKLEIMPKEERAKSIDMSVLKQIIAKPEIKKLFASKGIDVLDLVSSIIA